MLGRWVDIFEGEDFSDLRYPKSDYSICTLVLLNKKWCVKSQLYGDDFMKIFKANNLNEAKSKAKWYMINHCNKRSKKFINIKSYLL